MSNHTQPQVTSVGGVDLSSLGLEGFNLPDFSAVGLIGLGFLSFLVMMGAVIFVYWFFQQKKQYNVKVRIESDFNGRLTEVNEHLAKEFKFRDRIACLYIKDLKIAIPLPRYQSGHNIYKLIKLNNGRYKNFVVPSNFFGEKVVEIEVEKKELDSQNLLIKDYEDEITKKMESFLSKHGWTISLVILVVAFSIAFYFLQLQIVDNLSSMLAITENLRAIAESLAKIIEQINLAEGRVIAPALNSTGAS